MRALPALLTSLLCMRAFSLEATLLPELESFFDEKPKSAVDKQLESAEKWLDDGEEKKAEREYIQILESHPCHPGALRGLKRIAKNAASRGESKRAIVLYQRLCACSPADVGLKRALARQFAKEGRTSEIAELEKECAGCSSGDRSFISGDLNEAESYYLAKLKEKPCDASTLNSLPALAQEFTELKKFDRALRLYEMRLDCSPDSISDLYQSARLLAWSGERKKAESRIEHLLQLEPENFDAEMFLATLYYWSRRYEDAAAIFKRYPASAIARVGLGKVELAQGNEELAAHFFESAVAIDPHSEEARVGLARARSAQVRFREGKPHLRYMVEHNPEFDHPWHVLWRVQKQTDPTLCIEGKLSQSIEGDDDVGDLVRTDGRNIKLGLLIPIDDPLRVDLFFSRFDQREEIIPQDDKIATSYGITSFEGKINYIFSDDFSAVLSGTIVHADQVGTAILAMVETTRFEPSIQFVYEHGRHSARLRGGYDSIVAKDFDLDIAYLLRVISYGISYQYEFPLALNPVAGISFSNGYYDDAIDNIRWAYSWFVQSNLPIFEDYLSVRYENETRWFDQDTSAYYAYLFYRQHEVQLRFYHLWRYRTYLELTYSHSWKHTRDESRVIGDLVIQTSGDTQSNKFEAAFGHRFRDLLLWEISGSYYVSNSPYRAASVKTSFTWEF